jgi:hypothetical protein
LFGRSRDDPAPSSADTSDTDRVGTTLAHFSAMSMPQRAAELLENVTASLDEGALAMDQALAPLLPETDWMAMSPQQRTDWTSLALILREAFQDLVLTRMLIRQEQTYRGATWVTYVNSPDGRAAVGRRDVAEVVARRLPD